MCPGPAPLVHGLLSLGNGQSLPVPCLPVSWTRLSTLQGRVAQQHHPGQMRVHATGPSGSGSGSIWSMQTWQSGHWRGVGYYQLCTVATAWTQLSMPGSDLQVVGGPAGLMLGASHHEHSDICWEPFYRHRKLGRQQPPRMPMPDVQVGLLWVLL